MRRALSCRRAASHFSSERQNDQNSVVNARFIHADHVARRHLVLSASRGECSWVVIGAYTIDWLARGRWIVYVALRGSTLFSLSALAAHTHTHSLVLLPYLLCHISLFFSLSLSISCILDLLLEVYLDWRWGNLMLRGCSCSSTKL